jgi:hypothetical protein
VFDSGEIEVGHEQFKGFSSTAVEMPFKGRRKGKGCDWDESNLNVGKLNTN